MIKLTEARVRDLRFPEAGELCKWDSEVPGFGVRLRAGLGGKRKTFILKYRNSDGAQRKLRIGTWPALPVDEARKLARKHFVDIEKGLDPAEERQQQRQAPTMTDLAKDYLDRHGRTKRASSVRSDHAMFASLILPKLGSRKVASITRRDVENIHGSMASTPYRANRCLALLSSAFNTAIAWGWRTDNPAKGIKRYSEEKRDRWLRLDEVARLWQELVD